MVTTTLKRVLMLMTNSLQLPLFEPDLGRPASDDAAAKPVVAGVARVLMPNRTQMELRASELESLLPEGHRARVVWAYVEQADLGPIYAGIKAVEGGSGRTRRSRRRFYLRCGSTPRWRVWAVRGRLRG